MMMDYNIFLIVLVAVAVVCHMVLHVLLKRLQVEVEQLNFFKNQLEEMGFIKKKKFRTWKVLFKQNVLASIPNLISSPIPADITKYEDNEKLINQAGKVANTRFMALCCMGVYALTVSAILWILIK